MEPVAAAVSQGDEERARVCLLPADFQDILEVIPRHQVLVRKEGGRWGVWGSGEWGEWGVWEVRRGKWGRCVGSGRAEWGREAYYLRQVIVICLS